MVFIWHNEMSPFESRSKRLPLSTSEVIMRFLLKSPKTCTVTGVRTGANFNVSGLGSAVVVVPIARLP